MMADSLHLQAYMQAEIDGLRAQLVTLTRERDEAAGGEGSVTRTFTPDPMSMTGPGGIDRCDANNPVLIPRLRGDDQTTAPGWFPCKMYNTDQWTKPLVRCKCGITTGIGLHHVHADGRVTNSFFDSQSPTFEHAGKTYHHEPGCGWHVYIKLADYDCGEFPPRSD